MHPQVPEKLNFGSAAAIADTVVVRGESHLSFKGMLLNSSFLCRRDRLFLCSV